jgi:fatty-acyl-CoA synthase
MFQSPVNFDILSPVPFLDRSAEVYPDKVAVCYGTDRYTYAEFRTRVHRLANALLARGIGRGDKVAFICPNTPPMLEAHFAIPLIGAVLVAVNTELSGPEFAYIINHSEAKAVFVDSEFAGKLQPVLAELPRVEFFVNIFDRSCTSSITGYRYELFLATGGDAAPDTGIEDENQLIAINYTSGTTGWPKGVMYGHRATYLHALGEVIESRLGPETVYLWTLPMFHCNGWGFPWAVTAVGGTHICLRDRQPDDIFHFIEQHGVSHLSAAPTVLLAMINHPGGPSLKLRRPLQVITAGAAPTPAVIRGMEEIGANVIHVYGLTELHGPHSVCAWQSQWVELDPEQVSKMKARQGVPYTVSRQMAVIDQETGLAVVRDGRSIGEVVMRGNNVMLGYYQDPEATALAFRDGWFHSGDLAVVHPDGYMQIVDRVNDGIVRAGATIPSTEIEEIIYRHPEVLEVAVVATPDPLQGEVPKAFVMMKDGATLSEGELIDFCRRQGSELLAPAIVEFGQLPKTATGKTMKARLRHLEWQKISVNDIQ